MFLQPVSWGCCSVRRQSFPYCGDSEVKFWNLAKKGWNALAMASSRTRKWADIWAIILTVSRHFPFASWDFLQISASCYASRENGLNSTAANLTCHGTAANDWLQQCAAVAVTVGPQPCPATGHLDTSFSRFPCVYKQMLRWFPRFQVATTCFSCSPPDLDLLVTNFIFCIHVK